MSTRRHELQVAERERAEAEEARRVMQKEQTEARVARQLAHQKRKEAAEFKEIWAQRTASEQAAKWAAKREALNNKIISNEAERETRRRKTLKKKSAAVFGETRLWSRSGKRIPKPSDTGVISMAAAPAPPKDVASATLSPRALVTRIVATDPWFSRNEAGGNGRWTERSGTAQQTVLAARRTQSLPPRLKVDPGSPRQMRGMQSAAPHLGSSTSRLRRINSETNRFTAGEQEQRVIGMEAALRDVETSLKKTMSTVRTPIQLRRAKDMSPRPIRETQISASS